MKSKTAVLVTSCDAFEDCWAPFAHGMTKYWPDCPYPAYLITNEKVFAGKGLQSLQIRPDQGWARNLRAAVAAVDADVILYSHEDFWIKAKVDTAEIAAFVDLIRSGHADYIRLYPAPSPDRPSHLDGRIGELATEAPYRTSLQMALWRTSVLLELLRDDESCWEFELIGTSRSRRYGNRFLCVNRSQAASTGQRQAGIQYVCTAINKGRWATEAIEYCRREGLAVDFTNRPNETWWDDAMRAHPWLRFFGRIGKVVRNPRLLISRAHRLVAG